MAVLLSLPVWVTSSSTGERWAAVTLLAFSLSHTENSCHASYVICHCNPSVLLSFDLSRARGTSGILLMLLLLLLVLDMFF